MVVEMLLECESERLLVTSIWKVSQKIWQMAVGDECEEIWLR
jgi:hypothetical protein